MSYFIHAEIDHYQQFEYLFINHSMTKENSEQAMTLFCTLEKPQSSMANQSQNKEVIFIISICCSCLCNNNNNDNNNDNKTMQFISIFFPLKTFFDAAKNVLISVKMKAGGSFTRDLHCGNPSKHKCKTSALHWGRFYKGNSLL